jgi:tetratricopeptide (TPR) repeat protein
MKVRLVLLLALLVSRIAVAQEDKTKEAAAKYESGMAHYHLGEWDAAINDWQAGFRARPRPEFLYNIAQAYRAARRPERALQFYQSYLTMQPDAPNADAVRRIMEQLRRDIAQHPSQPKEGEAQSSGAPPSPSPSAQSSPPAEASVAPAATGAVVVKTPERHRSRKWVWGVVVGGVVVVAGAITLGVVLGTASNESTVPTVRF